MEKQVNADKRPIPVGASIEIRESARDKWEALCTVTAVHSLAPPPAFIAAAEYGGPKSGYTFKTLDSSGTGYYRTDTKTGKISKPAHAYRKRLLIEFAGYVRSYYICLPCRSLARN